VRRSSPTSPFFAAAHHRTVSPGATFDSTEITPAAPMHTSGANVKSSPERNGVLESPSNRSP
jgi:hypothetical protein